MGQIFSDAGLPPGVLNVLYCEPSKALEVVNLMIEHLAIKHINFTGSAGTGRKIARTCGENLKPCLMELEGKNSAIILPDADLEEAARSCIAGSFLNVRAILLSFSSPEYEFAKVKPANLMRMASQDRSVCPQIVLSSTLRFGMDFWPS
jgi:hypothetical protein